MEFRGAIIVIFQFVKTQVQRQDIIGNRVIKITWLAALDLDVIDFRDL